MGSDSVLLDLKILNGNMFLKFDKYVNNYTVNVASDVDTLEIEYKIRDVFLEVTSEEEKNVYTLEVYKEKIENVMKYEDVLVAKSDKEANENMPYIISFVCLVVILFFFVVIFHRKKSK